MKLSLNLVTASPGRNPQTFCVPDHKLTRPGGGCRDCARASDCWIRLRHFARLPLAASGTLRGGRPFGTKFFGAVDDAFDEIAVRLFLRSSIRSGAVGRNFKQ